MFRLNAMLCFRIVQKVTILSLTGTHKALNKKHLEAPKVLSLLYSLPSVHGNDSRSQYLKPCKIEEHSQGIQLKEAPT